MPDETPQGPIGVAVAAAKEYVNLILKGPLGELGGLLTDAVGQWRLRNQVRMLLRTKELLQVKGIDPVKLRPELFLPLVDKASLAEDKALSDMFASLLANHLDPSAADDIHPSFVTVLAQLSPLDAQVMMFFYIYVSYSAARQVGLRGAPMSVGDASTKLATPTRSTHLSCLNLHRLGIVEHRGTREISGLLANTIKDSPDHQMYLLTEYGVAFCEACNYGQGKG